jgi:hypothetical protein
VDIKIVKCESGHSPQLTWTKGLVAEVDKFGQFLLRDSKRLSLNHETLVAFSSY